MPFAKGFIKLPREWLFDDTLISPQERYAWIWLNTFAAFENCTISSSKGPIKLQRGQLSYAQSFLARNWGIPQSKVQRMLKRFAKLGLIRINNESVQSTITICEYDKFQTGYLQNESKPSGKSMHTSTQKRPYTDDNNKKEKNKRSKGDTPVLDKFVLVNLLKKQESGKELTTDESAYLDLHMEKRVNRAISHNTDQSIANDSELSEIEKHRGKNNGFDEAMDNLKSKFGEQKFSNVFSSTCFVAYEADILTLSVKSDFTKSTIETNHMETLRVAFNKRFPNCQKILLLARNTKFPS